MRRCWLWALLLLSLLALLVYLHDVFFQRRRQFRGVSLYFFLPGLSPSAPNQVALLPSNTSSAPGRRVLAVITGGWSEAQYSTPARMALLHDQLLRYVGACEAGWDVHVLLLTYEGWRASESVDAARYFCSRLGASLRISVQLFPMEPLPPGTHGTLGTLAFQHRAIFQRDAGLYDLFLVQEDDVAVLASHFDYFTHWAKAFEGSEFYPGFLFYELAPWLAPEPGNGSLLPALSAQHAYLDWRLNDAYLLRGPGSTPLLALWSSSCCAYMLTQAQLRRAVAQESWMGALARVKGEFNPFFGSARWLHKDYKVVVPAGDLRRAMLWHEPNKYALAAWKAEDTEARQAPWLNGLTLSEAEAVIAPCCSGCVAHSSSSSSSDADSRPSEAALQAVGEDCSQCKGAVSFKLEKQHLVERGPLKVAYECVREVDVMFPPAEDGDRALAARAS